MPQRLPITLASFAWLSACAASDDGAPKSDTFDGGVTVAIDDLGAATALRQQVEANWNIPGGNGCRETIVLRATVAADGTVQHIAPVGALPAGKSCRTLAETAFRALEASSPLNFPPDNQPPTVDFSFRLPDWVD
ncbi:hypothetical protein [Dongia sedimenti]|uniref:Cell envelope integrity protein TolA n=1 Tax=Dongia sedimenti TaxID=3064282 RepID=A0ABU0YVJ5_9PROT|nr:hypothetical protein [Rhodospirillaceae bacterium R-7]